MTSEALQIEARPEAVADDLVARRAKVQALVDRLRAERGAAHLDGKPFDPGPLNEAVSQLAALDDAATEQWRRAREAEHDGRDKKRAAALRKFRKAEAARLEAVAKADEAAAAMVAAALEAMKLAREAHRTAFEGLGRNLSGLDRLQCQKRFSDYLSRQLAALADSPGAGYLGNLTLSPSRNFPHARDWLGGERAAGAIPTEGDPAE